jgi:hypothetical protein
MGGLGLHDLYVEQGVRQISNLVGHLHQASATGRMMTIEHLEAQRSLPRNHAKTK